VREEQRRQRGCIAGRMPAGLSPRAAKAAARTIKKLQKVPVSAFRPVQGRIDTFGTMSWDRPKTAKKPKAPFHFDCDFDKHDLSRVGNIFGVPTWKIADRCVSWIRKQDLMVDGSRPASAHTASALSGSDTTRRMTIRATDSRTRTHCCSLTGSCECVRSCRRQRTLQRLQALTRTQSMISRNDSRRFRSHAANECARCGGVGTRADVRAATLRHSRPEVATATTIAGYPRGGVYGYARQAFR